MMHEDITSWLQDQGFEAIELNFNAQGKSSLILAAQQGRADVLAYLLQQGVDIQVIDVYGNNALWAACFAEALDCIRLLLQAGIDIDYQNSTGATALIYSASSGKSAVVAELISNGANPKLTTQDDFSALDLAANRQCLQLLRGQHKKVS